MSVIVFTQNDGAPDLTGTLDTSVVGATAEAHLMRPDGSKITRPVVFDTPATGEWHVDWQPTDLAQAGVWWVEIEVTFAGALHQTFGPERFRVQEQLA